jgi:adenosylmethionine-8-amino-7-oxononanoate aminotransferase
VLEPAGHLWLPYTQMMDAAPLAVARTEGVRIVLADGRELIDGISSWWTACHGYNHPHIVAAIERQAREMPHVMLGGLVHDQAARLAGRLARLLPGDLDHVFFSDSGSVAVEIALKMAVQYWRNRGVPGRTRFICFPGAYHGDTLGAMSVCDPAEGMHRLLAGYVPEQVVAPLPVDRDRAAALGRTLAEHRERIAAVIVEPLVQAAGGMRFHPPDCLAEIARLARQHGALLIADEIATGFGRTGTMFACEQAGVIPDIVCLGKALSGGALALAATVARRHVYEAFLGDSPDLALMHGPTFMGNAIACAAANASLDLFESAPRLGQVAAIERFLGEALARCRAFPGVADVRVKGAIGAVELSQAADTTWFRDRFVAQGVWIRPLGRVVYLMPPFTIEEADLGGLVDAVVAVVGEWAGR